MHTLVLSAQSLSRVRLLRPHGLQPARLFCPWGSPGKSTGVGCHFLFRGNLPNPGIEPKSPALQEDSLPSEQPGKPKNAGVGSLFLLQGIFPTQESNWCLLHCRRILYQLSYQGSPAPVVVEVKEEALAKRGRPSPSISPSLDLPTPPGPVCLHGNQTALCSHSTLWPSGRALF